MLTFGTILGIIVICLCALTFIIGTLVAIFSEWSKPEGFLAIVCAIVLAFVTQIGFMIVGYNGDYMAYKPVSGQVQDIASRQISDGKTMSIRYVFQINGQPYGVDDTRAALVKKGGSVSLNCVKEFVWGSTNNGYACNWG